MRLRFAVRGHELLLEVLALIDLFPFQELRHRNDIVRVFDELRQYLWQYVQICNSALQRQPPLKEGIHITSSEGELQ